ncbi:MAG: hypothetical protein R3F37_17970 [Candidatus Competibacteraceae bacterium]
MASESSENRIEKFKLKSSKNRNNTLALYRNWWLAKEIYLSDISIAVHLHPCSPEGTNEWKVNEAKEELYGFLRWFGHTALENNLMRPIAGVTLDKYYDKYGANVLEEISRWGADQEWHRGSFTLYIEHQESTSSHNLVIDRLADLLDPIPEDLENYEPKDPKNNDAILKEIAKFIDSRQTTDNWLVLANDLQKELSACVNHLENITEEYPLSRWVDKIKRQIELLAEGEQL